MASGVNINSPHGRVLASIDAYEEFHSLPQRMRAGLYRAKVSSSIDIVADDSLVGDTEAMDLLSLIQDMIDNYTFKSDWMKSEMLLHDYFMVARPLAHAITRITVDNQRESDKWNLKILKEKAEKLLSDQTRCDALVWVSMNIELACHSRSRMDANTYWFESDNLSFILKCKKPETVQIMVDNIARAAYRCRGAFVEKLIEASICGTAIPGRESKKQYPVFLQKHAIERIEERLDGLTLLLMQNVPEELRDDCLIKTFRRRNALAYIRQSLCVSLMNPEIIKFENSLLLAYKLNGNKIGYLPVRLIDEKVILTTFLFITMDGTPEGKKLHYELKLQRPDKEYLKLDRLETFLLSDVKDDAVLVRILCECGCDGVFNLVKLPVESIYKSADLCKKYLSIK